MRALGLKKETKEMQATEIPFYFNWSFWAVIVALIAVFLSQIPPIKHLLKKAKLEIEPYSKINITHKLGNPNLQLHLILTNIGGRKIRVKDINISLSRDNKHLITLPALNYLQNQNDQTNLLFTTFSLLPNQEWAHITNFLNTYNREDEKEYHIIEGDMIADYREKQKELNGNKDGHEIEHPKELIDKAFSFFNSKFIWEAGEYQMKIDVKTNNDIANISKEYRFTIFETQTEQLKAITEYYRLGGGIWYDPTK